MPAAPRGSGAHPIALVTISSGALAASREFYAGQFGWEVSPLSAEVAACRTPAGQAVALRAGDPAGFPACVPFVAVDDVDAALARASKGGAELERAKWKAPGIGELARLRDRSDTLYGLIRAPALAPREPLPSPFGAGPKPPAGALCAVELHARDFAATAAFVREHFGWGTLETMPTYMMFDAGAGLGGVFQSHTPALPAVAYVYVADVAAKLAELERAGAKRMSDPASMPGLGTFGYFTDPTGTALGLIGP
jgi:predicted enzyme related to lactoylglutathione lyase